MQLWELVVPTLLTITPLTRDSHVSRDVETRPEPVHAIEVFHGGTVALQLTLAVTTANTERHGDRLSVAGIRNTQAD